MKKMNLLTRQVARGLVVGAIAFGASAAMAQPAPPARPERPARPTRPAPPAPPTLPFSLDRFGDFDFGFDFDFNFEPPVPPLWPEPPLAPLPPLPPILEELGQSVRVQPPQPPQPNPNPSRTQELYEQAQNSINQSRYERAIEQLDRLIRQFDGQSDATAVANKVDGALYWKAYTLVKQKQITDALDTIEVMQKKFSSSRWMKDAKALEVEARQASGQSVSPEAQADEELKLLALRGIMHSDPDRGVPMIEQLLAGNSSVKVKENALFVLSQSRTARAREIITGVAKGGADPDLQLRAVRYLGAMGGPENRQILEEVYRATTDVSVKRAVIRSFVPSRDRTRLLSIAKSESSPELRSEAIQQLGAMRAVTELSELYSSESSADIKRRIIQSLMVSQASDKLLELARGEKDAQLRRTAIRNLGVMNASRTGELLRSLYAAETNPEVKKEIINAFFVQRNATTLVELARSEKDPALKREIVEKLSTMRDKVATDYLLEILK
jgi:hypothetical protein